MLLNPRTRMVASATALGWLIAAAPAWSADSIALPTAKREQAGIIILDGKSPPARSPAGNVATGIGAGGCAACDKQGVKSQPDAKPMEQVDSRSTGIGAGGCAACEPAPVRR